MSKTNVYLKKVISPKPKIGLFSFWFFSVGLCVCACGCLSVRAISRNLIKREAWNFAKMFMYRYSRNTIFVLQNSYFTILKPLFIFFTVCLSPRYLTPGIHSKPKLGLFSHSPQPFLRPSTHYLFISLFIYAQRLLKPTTLLQWRLPEHRDLLKT